MFKKRESVTEIEEGSFLSPKFDNNGLIPVITTCVNTKEILEPIFLKEVPTEVYPKIEKILLDLLKYSGYPNVKFENKVDFNELYKNRGN